MDKQMKAAAMILMWSVLVMVCAYSFSFARSVALEYQRPTQAEVYVIPGANGLKAIKFPDGDHVLAPGRKKGYQFSSTDEEG